MNTPPDHPVRIAITGSAGLYGRALVRAIRRRLSAAHVLGIDLREPQDEAPDEFWRGDIRDPALAGVLDAFRPDAVVHLAYAVQPGRDFPAMRAVNVDGTRRLLAATAGCGASRLLVASSGTVYGAWPDTPTVCDETTALRPRPDYYYAAHKGEVERLVADFAVAHPRIAVSLTRPTIICGAGVRNFLSDIFLTLPCVFLPDGADTPLQFVHEDDVAEATLAIIGGAARGPFNVAPADVLTSRQIAREMGVPAVPVPLFLVAGLCRAWWTLRLPWLKTPPGLVHYARHPWVMRSTRLERELGFTFTHSSAEAFRTLLGDPGRGPDSRGG